MRTVKGGTPKGSTDLCKTCASASIMTDDKGQKTVRCGIFRKFITTRVVECNEYHERNALDLFTMNKIAYHIKLDKQQGFLGFKPYRDFTDKEKRTFDDEIIFHDD